MAFIGEQQTTLFLGVGQIMFIIIAIIIFPKLIYKYYAFINAEKKGARNNLYYE